jgi:hypothetical protein
LRKFGLMIAIGKIAPVTILRPERVSFPPKFG